LTQREREIAALLIEGLDTRAISRRLSISSYTVQDHLKAAFDKVGIHSRGELLARLSSAVQGEPVGVSAKSSA
jgi:DNA-binding CsgD family transcriptional regulator